MTKPKHTPGPWIVVECPAETLKKSLYAGASHKINGANWVRIAETPAHRSYRPGDMPHLEECLATARLIASAPTLLKALEDLCSAYRLTPDGTDHAVYKAARQALKKAGGDV